MYFSGGSPTDSLCLVKVRNFSKLLVARIFGPRIRIGLMSECTSKLTYFL